MAGTDTTLLAQSGAGQHGSLACDACTLACKLLCLRIQTASHCNDLTAQQVMLRAIFVRAAFHQLALMPHCCPCLVLATLTAAPLGLPPALGW